MPLEADIVDRVRRDFDCMDSAAAVNALLASGRTGRIARCIAMAAVGSLARLEELIHMADRDYRDVIVAGEYDSAMQRVRDLRVSFLIDSPDHFWIGQMAVSADKRGYRLVKLESNPATVGPFAYTCDRSEGRAMFSNGTSTITVQKHNRRWSILPTGSNLRPFGLDAEFSDEERFRVQLDYYLSRGVQSSESNPSSTSSR
jgi:hypothetical protein